MGLSGGGHDEGSCWVVRGDEDHLWETNGLIESSSIGIYELYTGSF